jgi:hypothetical protein
MLMCRSPLREFNMRLLFLSLSMTIFAFSAAAQPKDCKTVSDSLERLKCYDEQAASPAPPAVPELPALTTQILKTEPPIGQLPPGAKVLIDDGTCPSGKLKQVVGGNVATGQPRLRSCVPRP